MNSIKSKKMKTTDRPCGTTIIKNKASILFEPIFLVGVMLCLTNKS